jgi:large subunit ribosomal protein L16
MLTPKRTKYRKAQKGRRLGRDFECRGVTLEYGTFGIASLENKRITSRQIESARRILLRFIRKGGKI